MDESATINPAALNAPSKCPRRGQPAVALSQADLLTVASIPASTIAPNLLAQPSPRGTKRSRSPDSHGGAQGQELGTRRIPPGPFSRREVDADVRQSMRKLPSAADL